MISEKDEYSRLILHRLDENWKSFSILYDLKHYGNCISILCQELDQSIRLLFLLKRNEFERESFIHSTLNSQKWHLPGNERKKEFITDEMLIDFAQTLTGWERSIYEFGFAFKSLSNSYNYMLKDPIRSLNETERSKIHAYIANYHSADFPSGYKLPDLIPLLPAIFEKLSTNLRSYMKQL